MMHRSMSRLRRKAPPQHIETPPTPLSEEEHEPQIVISPPDVPQRDSSVRQLKPLPSPKVTETPFDSVIDSFRTQNPNLQPLSPKEKHELDSRAKRHSIDPTDLPKRPLSSQGSSSATLSSVSSASTRATSRHSIGSVGDLRSKFMKMHQSSKLGSSSLSADTDSQTFWKYHVLEFGNDLYLSTNPDSKHLYCRHSPGIHVQIMYPLLTGRKEKDSTGKNGFKMIFKDQDDSSTLLTITKSAVSEQFTIEGVKRMHQDDSGTITALPSSSPYSQFKHIATQTEVNELFCKYHEPSSVEPIRYTIPQTQTSTSWNIGSIPQFKPGSAKLKNKRYIYFTSPNADKILACFRPHEARTKKKIIKKLNSSLVASATFRNEDALQDMDVVYYAPGDGIFTKDPPDDAPNSDKLGWITVFDDPVFKDAGTWELCVGMTLAIGFARVLEEKRSTNVKS